MTNRRKALRDKKMKDKKEKRKAFFNLVHTSPIAQAPVKSGKPLLLTAAAPARAPELCTCGHLPDQHNIVTAPLFEIRSCKVCPCARYHR